MQDLTPTWALANPGDARQVPVCALSVLTTPGWHWSPAVDGTVTVPANALFLSDIMRRSAAKLLADDISLIDPISTAGLTFPAIRNTIV